MWETNVTSKKTESVEVDVDNGNPGWQLETPVAFVKFQSLPSSSRPAKTHCSALGLRIFSFATQLFQLCLQHSMHWEDSVLRTVYSEQMDQCSRNIMHHHIVSNFLKSVFGLCLHFGWAFHFLALCSCPGCQFVESLLVTLHFALPS